MISLEDCIAFCGLDKDEVAAIGEHEHIPDIAATALADYLLKQPHGGEAIRTMIVDDIQKALECRPCQACARTVHGTATFPRAAPGSACRRRDVTARKERASRR